VQQELADFGPTELQVFAENRVGGLHCGCPVCGTYHSVAFAKRSRPTFSEAGVTIGVHCSLCGQAFTALCAGRRSLLFVRAGVHCSLCGQAFTLLSVEPVVVVRSRESWRNIGHDPGRDLGFSVGDLVRVRPRYWGYNGRMKPFTSRIVALWYYSGLTWAQVLKGRGKLPINVHPDKLTKL